jgi:hypothetical protein
MAAAQEAAAFRWSWMSVLATFAFFAALAFAAVFAISRVVAWWTEDDSYQSEPEEAFLTGHYYPSVDSGLHVRRYSRCNRFNECRFSGYELRFGGRRQSIANAGLSGAITGHLDLDPHHLLVAVNDTEIYSFDARAPGINGSGFHKFLSLAPSQRWMDVSLTEPRWPAAAAIRPKYLIVGARLFDQKTLKQVATVPDFRPVYYDGIDLYFLEKAGNMLRMHAAALPSSAPELVDEMPADCLNERGAALLMNAQEIALFDGADKLSRRTLLGSAPVNATKAGRAFQEMSEMPKKTERMTFYSLRGADFFDRYKAHCREVAFKGAPSVEDLNKFIEARMRENRR